MTGNCTYETDIAAQMAQALYNYQDHPFSIPNHFVPPSSTAGCYYPSEFAPFSNELNSGKKRRRVATIQQRKAANIRERKRMFSLNEGFEKLRNIVPTFEHEKKISRIDTLRLAIIYISFMSDILKGKQIDSISIRSLKHGWTSVREKLQQQQIHLNRQRYALPHFVEHSFINATHAHLGGFEGESLPAVPTM